VGRRVDGSDEDHEQERPGEDEGGRGVALGEEVAVTVSQTGDRRQEAEQAEAEESREREWDVVAGPEAGDPQEREGQRQRERGREGGAPRKQPRREGECEPHERQRTDEPDGDEGELAEAGPGKWHSGRVAVTPE
jgi:hypothetical protein